MNDELKKRTSCYIQNPVNYEIACDKCNGTNIEWSEYEGLIWCQDCKIDTPGTKGIFDGPIPLEVCKVLGISFDRYDIVNKRRIPFEEWVKNAGRNETTKFEFINSMR